MVVKVDRDSNNIQAVLAEIAVAELFPVWKADYNVPYDYKTGCTPTHKALIETDHKQPKTVIGGEAFNLVFPLGLIGYIEAAWSEEREGEPLFVGIKTHERDKLLNGKGLIIWSDNGRKAETKYFDQLYWRRMTLNKFALCPPGDFLWTYRFFEAIIAGAIPIVWDELEIYKPFHYFVEGDNYEYSETLALENLQLLKEHYTIPRDIFDGQEFTNSTINIERL